MSTPITPEVWLRGPVEGVPALLQPVAHALLQSREEVNALASGLSEEYLWNRQAGFAGIKGVASVGFHLQHLSGVLDRLFTYASGNSLTEQQLQYLAAEGKPSRVDGSAQHLIEKFNQQIEKAIDQLKTTDEKTLLEPRDVGRAKLPSNVIGLLFHAAEHVQRHTGQLLVTVKMIEQPVLSSPVR